MRMPLLASSAEVLLDTYGLYHMTQLQADPELSDLADGFRRAQEGLKAANERYRQAEAATLVALAVRDRKDAALDEAVMRFNHAVLEYVRKDRRAPLYVKYFADGLRPVTGAPLASEARKVGTILAQLANETVEELKSHAEPISTALQDLTAAIASHQAAVDAQARAQGLLQAEKIAWLDAYRQDHRKLQIHYHERPRRAEGYFRQVTRARGDGDDEAVETEESDEAAAVAGVAESGAAGAVRESAASAGQE